MYFRKNFILSITIFALLTGCVQVAAQPVQYPTYDPFLPIPSNTAGASPFPTVTITGTATATREPTPTRVPLTFSPPPSFYMSAPILSAEIPPATPTPDVMRILPTPRQETAQYVVQAGDTLGHIAQGYGISAQALMQANTIDNPNMLVVGMTLNIPAQNPTGSGSDFKVIPDSELVYSPAAIYFDIQKFIESQNGYLETYEQELNGITLTGYEIVWIVARNYSVNPRLLLALLEYQSGWVTNPAPFNTTYPMGFLSENHQDLYRQLTWTANTLNRGYYLWRANALPAFVLKDGSVVPASPTINAGTAAVQYFFSELDDFSAWQKNISGTGVMLTYYVFFGNPFEYAIEPLVPPSAAQPTMRLPYNDNAWYYTGGPHGGWDSGSAWSALDFAPPGDNAGCAVSPYWVTAIADGFILRASNGAVLQDLDNDGYEQTGWVILYMHIAAQDRIREGDYVYAGERIGHPSCEGGVSNATHLHIARKFNGEWIAAADPNLPFNMDGWIPKSAGSEYDGFLTRGGATIEAFDSANDFNLVYR